MAGAHIPGPLETATKRAAIDEGTSARTASPLPGPIGSGEGAVQPETVATDDVTISYDAGADRTAMTTRAITVLKEICARAGVASVRVTSTARTATDQARIMHDMIKTKGVKYAKTLYGSNGDKVVDTYVEAEKKKLSAEDAKTAMRDKIVELGPYNVSHHVVGDDGKLCVFDVAPSSISAADAKLRFVREAKAHAGVSKFLGPPDDPAYHLEILN